ncbi:MAG: hypothetical protein H7177_03555 [Rhizobacter sp.]|nr:hypothetical protein [Bacteriovorax sp.]
MILKESAIKINNLQKAFSAMIIVGLFFWLFYRYFSTKTPEVQFTETKTALSNLAIAEEKYFKLKKDYAHEPGILGLSLLSNKTEIYFSNKDIPAEYLKQIHENTMPYVSQKSFRLLGIYKDTDNKKIYMWNVDQTKNIDYIGYLSY